MSDDRTIPEQTACVFCEIVAGTAPALVVHRWDDAVAFTPIDPVVAGHTLIVPREHVSDATENPKVTAQVMYRAALYASGFDHSNIITSIGKPATQSIFHLHVHVIPRAAGDQLMVPWGTTGNPHDPHWCKVADALQAKLDAALLVQPVTEEPAEQPIEPKPLSCPQCGQSLFAVVMAEGGHGHMSYQYASAIECSVCSTEWETDGGPRELYAATVQAVRDRASVPSSGDTEEASR